MPDVILGAGGLRAHVVLRQDAARRQNQREAARGAFVGGHEFGDHKVALAAHEPSNVHHWSAFRSLLVAG